MQKFRLLLKNEKLKQYNVFALFIIAGNIILFGSIALSAPDKTSRLIAVAGILLVLPVLLWNIIKPQPAKFRYPKELLLLEIVVLHMVLLFWWAAAITLLLGLLYTIAKRKLAVAVEMAGISYPSFPKRRITWPELNNVVLKDGLLTLDFRNNKLIQVPVAESATTTVDEKEFNEFCSKQLAIAVNA